MSTRHWIGKASAAAALAATIGCSGLGPNAQLSGADAGFEFGAAQAHRPASGFRTQAVAPTPYLVVFSGAVPAGFSTSVAAAGGTVGQVDATLGLARVFGGDQAKLAAIAGVSAVAPDKPSFRLSGFAARSRGHHTRTSGAPGVSWNMALIGADKVWARSLGDRRVKVAVLDTGIDYNNPFLASQYDAADSTSFVQTLTDANGNPISGTDVNGKPIQDNGPDPMDFDGHGSHVAGIIAAAQTSADPVFGLPLSGVAPGVQVMAVKVLDASGFGDDFGIAEGIAWAVSHGARVINMSIEEMADPSQDPYEAAHELAYTAAINYATNHGVFVATAAGNFGQNVAKIPLREIPAEDGKLNTVVAAVGPQNGANPDTFSIFSDYGSGFTDLAAPGGNLLTFSFDIATNTLNFTTGDPSTDWVLSTWSTRALGIPYYGISFSASPTMLYAGTSMATPHVAGAAAQLISANPALGPSDVRNLLFKTADHVDSNVQTGHGRLNLAQAFRAATP